MEKDIYQSWTRRDGNVCPIDTKDRLYQCVAKLSLLLARSETLFIIDDIIAGDSLDKQMQSGYLRQAS